MTKGNTLSFPESVINFFKGDLGQPYNGFPKELQKILLKNVIPYTDRPNAHLAPIDFEKEFEAFKKEFDKYCNIEDFLSYKLYPKVFKDYFDHNKEFGDVSHIPTKAFFYGLKPNEEISVNLESGKTIIVQYLYSTKTNEKGDKTVFFNLNGQTRGIEVEDKTAPVTKIVNQKAVKNNEIGAPLQGLLAKMLVKDGIKVEKEQPLFVLEAMKMESTIVSPEAGMIAKIHLVAGAMVEQNDLIIEMEG